MPFQSLRNPLFTLFVTASLGFADFSAAQDDPPTVAGPDGMPAEVAAMFDEAKNAGAEISIAPSEEPLDAELSAATNAAGSRYLYTTLRVINNGSSRGCGYANWNCMTNLCKSDLGDSSAWRGWAGCWRHDAWICYFECGQRRNAF